MTKVEPFYTEVGQRIQKLRNGKKLSQTALGLLLSPKVTRASIANIETGNQRILAHTVDTLEAEFTKKLKLSPRKIKNLTAKVVEATRSKQR